MLSKGSWKLYRIILSLSLIVCNSIQPFAQVDIAINFDSIWLVERTIQDSLSLVKRNNITKLEQLKDSINSIRQQFKMINSLLEKGDSLRGNIKTHQVKLDSIRESQKKSKADYFLLDSLSRTVKTNQSLKNYLNNKMDTIEGNIRLVVSKIEKKRIDLQDLEQQIKQKTVSIDTVRDHMIQKLEKDSLLIEKHKNAIVVASIKLEHKIVFKNVGKIKKILSNPYYVNINKYSELINNIEKYKLIFLTLLEADELLVRAYSQVEVDSSLIKLKDIRNLRISLDTEEVKNEIDRLISLLSDYCLVNNKAFNLVEEIIYEVTKYEEIETFISNLEDKYPYLYSVFKPNNNNNNKLSKESGNPLNRQDSCKND